MSQDYRFPSTRWTLIGSLEEGSEEEKKRVWDWVSSHYWGPIYGFLLASGRNRQVSEDLTQQFFEKLLSEKILEKACPERGRLRSFLLGILKHMIIESERSGRAQKRGGGKVPLSMNTTNFELIYGEECAHEEDPEKIYERCWALTVIEAAERKLREEFAQQGRSALFKELEPYLRNEDRKPSFEKLAETLDSTPGAVRILVHRLRKRLRGLLESEVAQTLTDSSEVELECRWILLTLRRGR